LHAGPPPLECRPVTVVDAVVFDVGETLVDETREYGTWADWLGVPRHTSSAVFGAVIALGMDYRDAFQYFRPGFSLDAEVSIYGGGARKPEHKPDDRAGGALLVPATRRCLNPSRATRTDEDPRDVRLREA